MTRVQAFQFTIETFGDDEVDCLDTDLLAKALTAFAKRSGRTRYLDIEDISEEWEKHKEKKRQADLEMYS